MSEVIIYLRQVYDFMELKTLDEETIFCSISTFSGGGIGDAGIEWGCKVPVISACELVPDRAGLIRHNYPDTHVFQGDIWELKQDIIKHAQSKLKDKSPWLFVMSPPCQGMSSNGVGRIRASMAVGKRPKEDERNRLVLPGVEIVEQLKPSWFLLENVRRMENTIITNEKGELENILDMLGRRLHPLGYTIRSAIIDFRDLGVPHHRQRLITIGCRIPEIVKKLPPVAEIFCKNPSPLHPIRTHGVHGRFSHISMRESIGHMPALDSLTKTVDDKDPYHQIPKWNQEHYFCMEHTPEGCTAFDNNTCISCGYTANLTKDVDCLECGKRLPKPQINVEEWECPDCNFTLRKSRTACKCGFIRPNEMKVSRNRRVVRGFKTSYRRLKWDSPASTLTMNSGVISSDMKGHPEQNRVLSVREILLLSSLEAHPGANYEWDKKYQFRSVDEEGGLFYNGDFKPKLVRQVIGESIPPLAMNRIVGRLMDLDSRLEGPTQTKGISTQKFLEEIFN
jgi:DNA (cytosine-5)-methyltransferase 1